MHEPIPEQGRWLGQVVRGYFAYHAVRTNNACLQRFTIHVTRFWRRTLLPREQRDVTSWARIKSPGSPRSSNDTKSMDPYHRLKNVGAKSDTYNVRRDFSFFVPVRAQGVRY
jgi:hypothetical protein